MPAITVLMPVYNSEKFLAAAIESILHQTFQDFEFLIIDDGSTDQSLAIIRSYDDPRIRFYQNEQNSGISPTLNRGIQLAQSELIARMDADDIAYPTRLLEQYAYMQAHQDCAMVSSLVRVISETGETIRQDTFESRFLYYNLNFICWIYHPTVLYRKKAVEEAGMYTTAYSEDYELFWQLARNHKIYNLPQVLLDYRVTGQSLHQVLKKKEYDQAQKDQVLRNLRYYAGETYTIPENYLRYFQHDFTKLPQKHRVSSLAQCIRELGFLNQKILAKENVNRDVEAIKEAAYYKERFMVLAFARLLPKPEAVMFLVRVGHLKLLTRLLVAKLSHQK
ncbi:glycosyltransferase family 2 protein [Rufibacter latericius]|uniref:Glycosyltransferase n=1 Tax=Rufibacter latericius TaxID=2487040 RepID=A0A3M9MHC5_9BACT|nr:glycosyltransferase [Rufibacter latericius]RNI24547.1 glycosyltransferase [Rufibacter latericius]